jgi:diguanylate cyclase (GGDEF)-like protein
MAASEQLHQRKGLSVLRWTLVALVVALAAATVAVPSVLTQGQAVVERTNRHDIAWTGANGREELQRLTIALLRFSRTGADEDRDQALLDHEILLSRWQTWRSGVFRRFVEASPRRTATLEQFGVLLEAVGDDLRNQEDPSRLQAALSRLEMAEPLVESIASDAFADTNRETDRTRRALLDLQTTQQVLLFGLLGCGMLLLGLYAIQNRLLRRAHGNQKQIAQQHAYVASHDVLTGLANRQTFRQAIAEAESRTVTVLALDLDGFKPINDIYGHIAGDSLLVSIARRLEDVIATCAGSVAARFGGDEFFVLLPGLGAAEAAGFAGKILECLRQFHHLDGRAVLVGATIGLARGPAGRDEVDRLLSRADLALNRAKAAGKNTIVAYAAAMGEEVEAQRQIEAEIAQALERGEFEPYYQPQVDMPTGDVTGVEALVRWNHPTRGLLPPSAFIDVAESSGSIVEIGRMMLEKACRDAARFSQPLGISVNLSPLQLLRSDVPEIVAECLAKSGLAPGRLTLEITETVLMRDAPRCQAMIRRLRAMGVAVALDDFGTGYSSLSYLHGFGFDELKIDRSFVAAVAERDESLAIVHTIVTLGRNLGLKVVAEGIETRNQAALLMATGCRIGQGYLFGRPVSASAIAKMLIGPVRAALPPAGGGTAGMFASRAAAPAYANAV